MGLARLHRGRGDGSLPRLLVEPRRRGDRGVSRRRGAGRRMDHRRPGDRRAAQPARFGIPPRAPTTPIVTLHVLGLDGTQVAVDWDREFFPYVATVDWTEAGLLMSVVSRDQRGSMTLRVEPSTGETEVLAHDYDDAWIDLVAGVPRLLSDGRLVTAADRDGARRLLVDGEAGHTARPPGARGDRRDRRLDRLPRQRDRRLDGAARLEMARRRTHGDHDRTRGPRRGHRWTDHRRAHRRHWTSRAHESSRSADIVSRRSPSGRSSRRTSTLFAAGDRGIATAVLLPHDHDGSPLPVLLDPYGGPHALRVQRSSNAFASAQWFADQGFAVVVADGRGTPGRGTDWERAVHLRPRHGTARRSDRRARTPRPSGSTGCSTSIGSRSAAGASADSSRPSPCSVGPTCSTPRSPEHRSPSGGCTTPTTPSATSGIPTTRRTGTTRVRCCRSPATSPDRCCSSTVSPTTTSWRPHTLQFSSALLAAGKPHEVLPLVGVTHMTPQEEVAENLLLHQLDFLRRSLRIELPT